MDTNEPIVDRIDPEILGRLATRREAIRQGATASALLP